ncbi:glutamyl-tRNA reductase [Nocardioides daphniae]|uniref:Glutamyl-tRNA reductase n=1 Tax=Nocardioides daphniae TaxID=402297 RepID=A0ABQ1QAU8_9ACTN|nr:glutamyl-tRNA reductase [Nocardioides daphniae]GGD20397.1 glutamyl-tRNA reductase [Nocardioides daphniae]
MSVLVVGISHKSAPVSVLESLALDADGARKLVLDAVEADHVGEVAVISTCNRLEIYADVERFHGSVEDLSRLLVARSGAAPETMVPHLYVHYEDGAVSHLFHVAAGMDSMVLGEGQILGQAREALRVGQELGTVGPALNSLFQQALRVGKRTHAETDVDSAAPSMVSAALGEALGDDGVRGVSALVLGAGSMASLAVATLTRQGARQVVVANRSLANAERLAAEYGVRAVPMDELSDELGTADVLITCTGASGVVLTAAEVAEARDGRTQPLTVLDLALPHDVDPAAAELPGVEVLGLADLADRLGRDHEAVRSVDGVREIVAEEVQAFLSARRQASVTPTVVALRTMATGVVESELERLEARLGDADPEVIAEVRRTVHRVAEKLLHQPTVRVRELADEDGAVSYATALAELFALDPDAVQAVTRSDIVEGGNA